MLTLRPMRARDPEEHHRTATQLELFFDLVAVIAIAAVTEAFHHSLSEGHGPEMLGNFAFLFVAIWWAWMNHSWFASAFDNDDGLYRLLTMVIMAGFLVFAAGAGEIFRTIDFKYGVGGWIIMRIGMMALWLRASRHEPGLKRTAMRYFWGIAIAQTAWTVLYFTQPPGSASFLMGSVVIFAIEFSVPVVAEAANVTPWHRHHIMERYGLLNIIVLGEVLVSLSLSLGHLYEGAFDASFIITAISGLGIVFALWWAYFVEQEHLASRDFGRAFIWGYGHVFVFASGALLAAGMGAYTDVLTHHAHIGARAALVFVNLPVAAYFLTLWAIRDRFQALGWHGYVLPCAAGALVAAEIAGAPLPVTAVIAVAAAALRRPEPAPSASADAH